MTHYLHTVCNFRAWNTFGSYRTGISFSLWWIKTKIIPQWPVKYTRHSRIYAVQTSFTQHYVYNPRQQLSTCIIIVKSTNWQMSQWCQHSNICTHVWVKTRRRTWTEEVENLKNRNMKVHTATPAPHVLSYILVPHFGSRAQRECHCHVGQPR